MSEAAESDVPTTAIAAEAFADLARFLQRVAEGMNSDTATVLLIDPTRTVLEPAATVGLEPTLHGARPIPLGQGFAGRVAQSRQPVVLGNVDPTVVINPVLLEHGVRSLLGVPVMDGSELLGVLHVGHFGTHEFDDDEKRRLTQYASDLAAAIGERAANMEQEAAYLLQRSLLPRALHVPEGFAMAARYVPASGDLGGDWYDVFEVPGPRFTVVMGDVVGHGLESAIIMGRLRSALRAYALDYDDPAEALRHLDRKVCLFEPDALATVIVGMSSPPFAEWRFSSAGHFAPLVGMNGELPHVADISGDHLLGVDPDLPRRTETVLIPPGGFFCLFTDGLLERRPEAPGVDPVETNLSRLASALAELDDPEMGCIRVLTEVIGENDPEDDVALLIAQRVA